ncbi:hypothetical protein [Pseudomonas chlororaphis]|uniref:hypothetical protein n=1 Tax=Pseudomonas chlororaphis TaxID=587753 RepID=UPI000F572B3D|nr:hypothetical protein [Pseudomonas chlororaphis]WDG70370.1 hypothetical protein PUP65_19865 [Pseudomonas chlororaphis]WDH31843.1 hypothetical protein PUP81_14455 [Pseudomonas chlororaphis]WDH68896.1 hypothetical protein PUP78_19850 [Pseudomonas chlororaphis]
MEEDTALPRLFSDDGEIALRFKEAIRNRTLTNQLLNERLSEEEEHDKPVEERTGDAPRSLQARLNEGRKLFAQIRNSGGGKVYLGRRGERRDEDLKSEKKRGRVLSTDVWSIALNDAFIAGAIDASARGRIWWLSDDDKKIIRAAQSRGEDLVSSVVDYEDKSGAEVLWRKWTEDFPAGPTITSRELGQLMSAGYVFSTVKLKSKGEIKTKEVFFPNRTSRSVYLSEKRIKNKLNPVVQ